MLYQIVYSDRKTLALHINKDANLIVRSPKKLPQAKIETFIKQKENWIQKSIQKVKSRQEEYLKQTNKILYLGKIYALPDFAVSFNLDISSLNSKTLFLFLKKNASEILFKRMQELSRLTNFKFADFGLSNAKTTWGFCTSKNKIGLNWRLIMAKPEVIDYVIIHELVHIKHKNHSGKFWNTVQQFNPNYRANKLWLKQNSAMLMTDFDRYLTFDN